MPNPSPRNPPAAATLPTSGHYDESADKSCDVQVVKALDRRRKWSEQEKAAIVSESMLANTTVQAVARKYDIHPRVLYRWKAELLAAIPIGEPAATSTSRPLLVPKKRGRKPKNRLPAMAETPPAKVFAVEPTTAAPPAVSDGVRLLVGDLIITIQAGKEF